MSHQSISKGKHMRMRVRVCANTEGNTKMTRAPDPCRHETVLSPASGLSANDRPHHPCVSCAVLVCSIDETIRCDQFI